MSDDQAYSLAHTAQCKLHLAASRPDRDLRFVLGHAFTFEKLMLRIVEIEGAEPDGTVKQAPITKPKSSTTTTVPTNRRVSFQGDRDDINSAPTPVAGHSHSAEKGGGKKTTTAHHHRAPSPPPLPASWNIDGSDSSDEEVLFIDEEEEEEEEEEGEGDSDAYDDDPSLSLTRYDSASARPPQQIHDFPTTTTNTTHTDHVPSPSLSSSSSSSSEDDDDDEPPSPPSSSLPSDSELRILMTNDLAGDPAMAQLYETVRTCPCQSQEGVDQKAPPIEQIWELPPSPTTGVEEKKQQQQSADSAVLSRPPQLPRTLSRTAIVRVRA